MSGATGKRPGIRSAVAALAALVLASAVLSSCVAVKSDVHADANDLANASDATLENAYNQMKEPYYYEVQQEMAEKAVPHGSGSYVVPAVRYSGKSADADVRIGSYEGKDHVLLWSNPKGWIEYEIEVEDEGLYEITAEYAPISDGNRRNRRASILSVQVNGGYPFREARSLSFEREFRNEPPRYDSEGNQLQSLIEEIRGWKAKPFRDSDGAYAQALLWHLRKGNNRIRLQLSQQPIAFKSFTIRPPEETVPYAEAAASLPDAAAKTGDVIVIEGEQFAKKNSTSIQTQYDRDAFTTPKSLKNRIYNVVGGWGWYKGGQSVSWEFEVPEDGLYKIGMRVNQSLRKNLSVFRTIYIDGEIPYRELRSYRIGYAPGWRGETIADRDGEPFVFYLSKGKHTLTMEAGYEPYMPVIARVEPMVESLKSLMNQIRSATGNRQDDQFRVWDIEQDIPGAADRLNEIRMQLNQLVLQLQEINQKVDIVAQTYRSAAKDLEELLAEPEKIPVSQLILGAILEQLQEQYRHLMDSPLAIDKIYIAPADEPFPRMEANWFEKTKAVAASLYYSFDNRYKIGTTGRDTLNVWMMMGRDYVDELQMLADERFTPEYGIKVKVNLVQSPDLLILAKASGILPDIALGVPGEMPFEMALRGAALDILSLPGGKELIEQYHPGTMLPFYYDGGYYGIPETTSFKVLFYRKDILAQLNLDVPDTWEDVYRMIPVLLKHQYNFYIPPEDFSFMFYQNGVELYTADGMSTGLNRPEAFRAFQQWTDLFNIYGLERQVQSFYNQFRSGTMPIGISDFNMYMQLMVAAPDILNEWGIAPVPGTRQPDGSIVRWAAGSNPTSALMFSDTPQHRRDMAWKFMQWYLSEEVQTEYGLNLEQFRGEAFRWNTANVKAFANMPWNADDLKVILEQWKWIKDIPNVPGGYMTPRELRNAWLRAVVPESQALESPRVALEKAIKTVTRELERKQREFHFRDETGRIVKTMELPIIAEPWNGADIHVE